MDKHYRQGDILLIKISVLPPLTFKEKKDKVILEGEVAGHAHKLEGGAKVLEVAEEIANAFGLGTFGPRPNSQVIGYAVVDAPAELTHDDHPTITIPPGEYQIRRQKEYDEKEARFVED